MEIECIKKITEVDKDVSKKYRNAIVILGSVANGYLYCATSYYADISAMLKINTKDLSLVWACDFDSKNPVLEISMTRPYLQSANLIETLYLPPNVKSGRNYPVIVGTAAQVFSYSTTQSDGYGVANPSLSTEKFNPGYYQDCGLVVCLRDNGSTYNIEWRFNNTARLLVAGEKLSLTSWTPGKTELNIRCNLQHGLNLQDTPHYTLKGRQVYVNNSNNAPLRGNTVISSLIINSKDPNVAKPVFLDLFDNDNISKLKNGTFDASENYVCHPFVGAGINMDDYGTTNKVNLTQNIVVPGSILIRQPIVKTLNQSAVDNYVLTENDAYHLNYFGCGIYGNVSYDPELDRIYVPSSNGTLSPLQDQINVAEANFSKGGKLGTYRSNWQYLSILLQNYNANRTQINLDALHNGQQLYWEREAERKLISMSPRCNRFLHGSLTALNVKDGALVWSKKGIAWDCNDWDQGFRSISNNSFMDRGLNADYHSSCLVKNEGVVYDISGSGNVVKGSQFYYGYPDYSTALPTTKNRMVICSGKHNMMFFDPDRSFTPLVRVTGDNSNKFIEGIVTVNSPLLHLEEYPEGSVELFDFGSAASNGNVYVVKHNLKTTHFGEYSYNGYQGDIDHRFDIPVEEVAGSGVYTNISTGCNVIHVYDLTVLPPKRLRTIVPARDITEEFPGRGNIVLYDDVVIMTHMNFGGYVANNIKTGQEVWRHCTGANSWNTPLICNNVLYDPGSRSNAFATTPNFADAQFVKMYTLDGI
jgi:hypothetical protein